MKRNFKVIKHDKTLSNLSDAEIDKLYSTYIEMDGKHQNFKGSKREYCSTVAGMIKDWMKAVVDKNGGYNENLQELSGGKGRHKEVAASVKAKEKELSGIEKTITRLRNEIEKADTNFKVNIPAEIQKIKAAAAKKNTTSKKKIVSNETEEVKKIRDRLEKLIKSKEKDYEDRKAVLEKNIEELEKRKKSPEKIEKEVSTQRSIIKGCKDKLEEYTRSYLDGIRDDPSAIRVRFPRQLEDMRVKIENKKKELEKNENESYGQIDKQYNQILEHEERRKENPRIGNLTIKIKYKEGKKVVSGDFEVTPESFVAIKANHEDFLKQKKVIEDETEKLKVFERIYDDAIPMDEASTKRIAELTDARKLELGKKIKLDSEIKQLQEQKIKVEAEIPEIAKRHSEIETEKKEEFKKTIKNVVFSNRPVPADEKPTDEPSKVKKLTGDDYTLTELVDESFKYRRVIKMLLGGELYPDWESDKQGSVGVQATKNFLRALPYKKLLEISPEGYDERVKFVNSLIAKDLQFKDWRDIPVRWTVEVEESFRSESFVFWNYLAKDMSNKNKKVENFNLLGKIFAAALFYDPVDFRLKYYTGDSKGVVTSSTETREYSRGYAKKPVVGLRKLFAVLHEAATIKPSGEIEFNNPRIIFTFYRKNRNVSDPNPMLEYSQDSERFGGKLPYEVLLDYDLKVLLEGPYRGELEESIRRCKKLSRTKDINLHFSNSKELMRKIVEERYPRVNLFPIGMDVDAFVLPIGKDLDEDDYDVRDKARSDLKLVGYSKDFFGNDEPSIEKYVELYENRAPIIKTYTGSFINDFVFEDVVTEDPVVTEIVAEGITDDTDDVIATAGPATESPPIDGMKTLTKLTEAQKAALKKSEAEAEGTDEGRGKPQKGSGKPKSYIKKIIKYYC